MKGHQAVAPRALEEALGGARLTTVVNTLRGSNQPQELPARPGWDCAPGCPRTCVPLQATGSTQGVGHAGSLAVKSCLAAGAVCGLWGDSLAVFHTFRCHVDNLRRTSLRLCPPISDGRARGTEWGLQEPAHVLGAAGTAGRVGLGEEAQTPTLRLLYSWLVPRTVGKRPLLCGWRGSWELEPLGTGQEMASFTTLALIMGTKGSHGAGDRHLSSMT